MPDTSTATTTFAADEARRAELAEFLKRRRAGIAPTRVGLKGGLRRRARGLLREEVAQLAGISPTWYVWLEQGRDIHPSRDVLANISAALLLNDAERDHLFVLAEPRDTPSLSTEPTEELRAFLAGLRDQPAYIVNGLWDLLAWNAAARALFGDFAQVPPRERNVLMLIFNWAPWRELLLDRATLLPSVVAQFRAATAQFTGEPRLVEILQALMLSSPEFARHWEAGAVQSPGLYSKRLSHPTRGETRWTYAPLRPPGAADDIAVVVYSPA